MIRFVGLTPLLALVLLACGSHPPANHRTLGLRHAAAAEHAWSLGRYPAAAHNFNAALRHLRAADDPLATARLLHNYAVVLIAWRDCRAAAGHLHEAAALHQRLDRPRERAMNLLALAGCKRRIGDGPGARKILLKAAQLAEKAGDKAAAARARAGIGAALAGAGDLASAQREYVTAGRLAAASGQPGAVALVDNNLGRLLARKSNHKGAELRFARAADGFRKAGDVDGLSQALANRAASLAALGGPRVLEAAVHYQRAAHAAVTVGRYDAAAAWFAGAATAFSAAGERELAEQCRQHGRHVLNRSVTP